jgi:hypothetical protein
MRKMCSSSGLMLIALLARLGGAADEAAGWEPLFNGRDLSGWETYLGTPPDASQPLGLDNDPRRVFTVLQEDGERAIRVSGEILGALTTRREFSNYWLRLEFKWGAKRWPPDEDAPRNSGVLYHCFGPHGAIVGMCMRSHECQIKERECGDYWSSDTIVDVEGEQSSDPRAAPHRYRPGGAKFTVHDPEGDLGGRVAHRGNFERPLGQWNRMDIVCLGQSAVHAVNGHVTIRVTNSRRKLEGREVPLTGGKIQLLSERAEIFFRRIAIKPMQQLPPPFRRDDP